MRALFVFVAMVGCGGNTAPSLDAGADAMSDASDAAADVIDASCGPVDLSMCNCMQPMPECCAALDTEDNCVMTSAGPTCLPSCSIESYQCSATSGTLNFIRPMCNAPADCAQYATASSCCNVTCQPHRLSVCLSAAEAAASNLTCM